jgi:hypothetical protein
MKNKKKNRAFHLFALQTWLFPLNPNCFTLIQRYTVILKNKLLRFFPWNHALSHPPHFRRKNSNYSFSLFTKLIPLSILIHHPSSSMFSPLTLLSDLSLSLSRRNSLQGCWCLFSVLLFSSFCRDITN